MKAYNTRLVTISLIFGSAALAHAQSFSPGTLAVLRLGDGVQALTNTGNTMFVDQYSTNGSLVGSIAIPDEGGSALLLSGVAGSEGSVTRSSDHSVIALSGYNIGRGVVVGSLSSQTATAVPRAIATIGQSGNYNLVQSSASLYSQNNIRGAATDGTNDFWTAGGNSGTLYLSPPQSPATIQNSIANTRFVKIINEALYFTTQAATAGIYGFQGEGLPKAMAMTNLLFATGANSQPAAFDMNSSLTIAYVADQRNSAGGIQKWINDGTGWSLAYTFPTGAGAFGIAVDFGGAVPVIYATTGESSANRLVSIVDSGGAASVTLLATSGSNQVFRGLDFAPQNSSNIGAVSLGIQRSGSDVVLSWSANATGYVLQATARLDQPNSWSNAADPVLVMNGSNTVTIHATNAAQYYRLKQ